MRTKNWVRHIALGVLGLWAGQARSQVTIGNNNGLGGAFVGWNAGANQILEVRNDANKPINWFTDAIERLSLLPNATYTIVLSQRRCATGRSC